MKKAGHIWIAAVLASLASAAMAQSIMYRCKNHNGTISFSDRPCPGQAPGAQPQVTVPNLSPSERRIAQENMGVTEAEMRKLEADCAQGSAYACTALERSKIPKSTVLTPSERQTVMRNSNLDERFVRQLEDECAKGGKEACAALNTHKTRTQAELTRETIANAEKECARGNKQVCDALRAGERWEQESREAARRAAPEARRILREHYQQQCAAGDQSACREYFRKAP